jgi:hypothetical protein
VADFQVSLFIAPRLVPDGDEAPLGSFDLFPHWASVLLDPATTFELWDNAGPIPAAPLLSGVVSEDMWNAAFPEDTPVRAATVPDWKNRHWRTFSAAVVHDLAKTSHVLTATESPTGLPSAINETARAIGILGGMSDNPEGWEDEPPSYDERRITETLDRVTGENRIFDPKSLAAIEKDLSGNSLGSALAHLHRVRRFYERPEAAQEWLERPDPHATPPAIDRRVPDFHERCTTVGDHPPLQRALGLVIDLKVERPNRLRNSAWLAARIAPRGDDRACRTTRTTSRAVGDALVTAPNTADWSNGRLRLGDVSRFRLLDLDVDGSALKLERYVLTLPRLLLSKLNGDPVHAAPPALRSNGFTLVRAGRAGTTQNRLDKQQDYEDLLEPEHNDPPMLFTEDVARGMRVEVWDNTAKAWFSLHTRRINVDIVDSPIGLNDEEEGFIQGTTASETPGVEKSPIHIHEAVFGWEGWSLSAPKPGKRVVHRPDHDPNPDPSTLPDRNEEVEDTPIVEANPITPIAVRTQVKAGTLPRLRYGREYMFRAWAVDLAGNSRPHDITVTNAAAASLLKATSGHLDALATTKPAAVVAKRPLAGIANQIQLGKRRPSPAPDALAMLRERGGDDVHDTLMAAIDARPQLLRAGGIGRATLVNQALADAVRAVEKAAVMPTMVHDPAAVAAALAAGDLKLVGPLVKDAVDTVSPLLPFLRWDPVQPPAMVARHRYTAGESLRQLVIRSWVDQDLATLAITVTPPAAFAASANPALDYHDTCERHLIPPKSSQSQAELHGCFDGAIGKVGAAAAAAQKLALAGAVREKGTLFDIEVPRLDDVSIKDPQPNISLHPPKPPDPTELKELPLAPGEAPGPGQYVLHDVDELVLPYLPDPIARGVSFVFPEAGADRVIEYPFATEGFTARYKGKWPALRPYRLVLEGGTALLGKVTGTQIRVALPPADVQRFRLASSLDLADLNVLGLWRTWMPFLADAADVAEAIADGWLWAFTPFEDVTLVHAVPRPLEAPRVLTVNAVRDAGSTESTLVGGFDVHGASTESVTAEATWTETIDDIAQAGPEDHQHRSVAWTVPIAPDEDLAGLLWADAPWPVVGGTFMFHANKHKFPDTKHRNVSYRLRATTRFREYFEPSELAPPAVTGTPAWDAPVDDGKSVVSEAFAVSVPSSARPAPPVVHSVIPLFIWDEGTEPEQPVAYRRRRRPGVRIYLERPWYSSGDGELLGVLLEPGATKTMHTWASQWGGDPLWLTTEVDKRSLSSMQLVDFFHGGISGRPPDATPVVPTATLPLTALKQNPTVQVLGYQPEYAPDRRLWFVDVAFEGGATFWPFVRLAVARYQPDSIPGCHLSAPARCDYVQLTPRRTATVARTDARHIRVVVTGPVGVRSLRGPETVEQYQSLVSENRTMIARLQRRDPTIPTDLGWETVTSTDLVIRGTGPDPWEVTWVGALEAPKNIPLVRPGDNPGWRVVVEEWEMLPGDPKSLAPDAGEAPVWEKRIVYADEFTL